MSVATQNKFALLNDDDEGVATTAPIKAPVVEEPAVAAAPQARTTNNRGRAAQPSAQSRSGRYYKRGGAPVTETTDADTPASPNPNVPGQRFDRTDGRPGRGRGRGRGGRGSGDRPPRGRYHDRESQTGRVDTEKATNQGWGADTGAAELGAELQGAADAHAEEVVGNGAVADTTGWEAPAADTSGWDAPAANTTAVNTSGWDAPAADASGWGAPAPGEAANGEANKDGKEGEERRKRRDDEEEDNTLTLDEYLAKKRTEEQAALPKLDGQRVINDNAEWKGAVPLLKEDNEYFVGKTKSAPKTKPKKEEKVYIPIDLPPAQRDNRGRGRGGRGGERGGRGRGGDRGGERGSRGRGGNWDRNANGRNAVTAQVDVDDASAFPSLS